MKQIQLGGHKPHTKIRGYALIDDEDYAEVSKYHWSYVRKGRNEYAVNTDLDCEFMHRLILKPKPGEFVDHVNHNGLDNRRCNIRTCSAAENTRHAFTKTRSSSGYRGVTKYRKKTPRPWQASIKVNGVTLYLGVYATAEEAAKAYDEAASVYHGNYATLNFDATM